MRFKQFLFIGSFYFCQYEIRLSSVARCRKKTTKFGKNEKNELDDHYY